MTATTVIEHVVDIDAAPATVFSLWTTAEGLSEWWGQRAEADPRPGGVIRVDLDGEHVMSGEFVHLDEPHHITFTFGWEEYAPGEHMHPGSTTVDVRIEAVGSGSRVTLRHHGLPLEFVGRHAVGWTHFLGNELVRVGHAGADRQQGAM